MPIETIQELWDAQEPAADSIDSASLTRWLRQRSRYFDGMELLMILTLLFVALMFARDPLLQGHDRILLLGSLLSLLGAGFVWMGRTARKRREPQYERSLLGIVEQSMDAIDYQIRRLQSFLWWFVLPNAVGLCIGLWIVDESKRYLFYSVFIPAFIACMTLATWQIRNEIRRDLHPKRERLQELHRQLTNGSDDTAASNAIV